MEYTETPPYEAEDIDLSGFDEAVFYAKQISPVDDDPKKSFTITGVTIPPASTGVVSFTFTPGNLDTPGKYICRIKLIKAGFEVWSLADDFEMYVRASF